jgi:hypothetical protein
MTIEDPKDEPVEAPAPTEPEPAEEPAEDEEKE